MGVRKSRRWLLVSAAVLAAAGASAAYRGWSHSPSVRFERAWKALQQGDLAQVEREQIAVCRAPGYEEHCRLLSGVLLLAAEDYPQALRELAGIDPRGPLGVPARLRMGECLYRLNRLADAERVLKALLVDEPDCLDAHRWLAATYYDLWAVEPALVHLRKVAELDPDDYRPHHLMGIIYRDVDKFREAGDAFAQALARHPPPEFQSEIAQDLAQVLIVQREYDSALKVLEQIGNDDVRIPAMTAECYWGLGRADQAAGFLETARRRDPQHRSVLLLTAQMAIQNGDPQAALEPLRTIVARDPHDHESRYRLALLYRQLGDGDAYAREIALRDASLKLVQRLHQLNVQAMQHPRDAAVRDEIATVCKSLGKTELAAAWKRAAEACRQSPASADSAAPAAAPRPVPEQTSSAPLP